MANQNQSKLSDQQLLDLSIQYGSQAKLWRQKFLGLLPEIAKRQLYVQKGCSSIFEFAYKFGGVSREQVLLVLRLERRFEQTPQLHQALTSGRVTMHKLATVASVVQPHNQDFWLNQSKLLSARALETLVRDVKHPQPVHVNASNPNKIKKVEQSGDLRISPEVNHRLVELQNKGLDLNQLLTEFLDQREEKIYAEKHRVAEELKTKTVYDLSNDHIAKPSRYIPAKVKRVLQQEFGVKCAHQTCSNRSINIHHTKRFGVDPDHNPFFLAPLCRQHHEIAHALDLKMAEMKINKTLMG